MESGHSSAAPDQRRLQTDRDELAGRIARVLRADGVVEPLPGLHLARVSHPRQKFHSVLEPSFCVIAQGSKEVLLGESRYVYDPSNYLFWTLDLPRVSRVLEASPERPYLSFRLELDPQLVSTVLVEASHIAAPRASSGTRAIDVSPLDGQLLDPVVRMVRLIETPAEAPILLPWIAREIVFRLLMSDQGERLRHMTAFGAQGSAIARAVQRIRRDFDQPLRIEDLAKELGLSVSTFHAHFKTATAMSPLQFQKQLRLQEARRLMLSENLDAASAAYRVGYHDAAYFSREYKSVFGNPPARDVQHLRETGSPLRTP
jgi:AraC-like DNA-binding protein